MKLFLNPTSIHHSNRAGLNHMVKYLNIDMVNNIGDADVVYSPSQPLPIHNYPYKKFIFGPHFSVFPNQLALSLNGVHNNAVYIQPSQPSVDTWVGEFGFKNIPVRAFPFPLNVDGIKVSNNIKDKVLVYHKYRKPEELKMVLDLLSANNVTYEVITYGKYNEGDYQRILDSCKYVIWVGCHESQGFALESVLAKNIPILVWSVKLRIQQAGWEKEYANVKSEVTSVPYWDERCGEKFYTGDELENSFNTFISKLDSYKPREFTKEVLSIETCSNNLLKLIDNIGK